MGGEAVDVGDGLAANIAILLQNWD
jgi:hypothetical protein